MAMLQQARAFALVVALGTSAAAREAPSSEGRLLDLSRGWLIDHAELQAALGSSSQALALPVAATLQLDPRQPGLAQGEMLFEFGNLPGGAEVFDLHGAKLRFVVEVEKDLLAGPLTFVQPFVVTRSVDDETARQYGLARPIDYTRQHVTFRPSPTKRWAHTDGGMRLDRAVAVGLKVFAGPRSKRSYQGTFSLVKATLELPDPRRWTTRQDVARHADRMALDPHVPFACSPTRSTPHPPVVSGIPLDGEWRAREGGNAAVLAIQRSGTATWRADLHFDKPSDSVRLRTASLVFNLPRAPATGSRPVTACVNVGARLRGSGSRLNWFHLALEDEGGRQATGPGVVVSDEACRWLCAEVWGGGGEPIPLGSLQPGFDPSRVARLVLKFELARFWEASADRRPLEGSVYVTAPSVGSERSIPRESLPVPELPACTAGVPAVARADFEVGVNYPWVNYGWDIGTTPFDGRTTCGLSLRQERLTRSLQQLAQAGVEVVRFFLWADLITGVSFGEGDQALGLDVCVERDLDALFAAAHTAGLKLMPVLLDYTVADGRRRHDHSASRAASQAFVRFSVPSGERTALLTNPRLQALFIDRAVRPLLRLLRQLDTRYGNLHSLDLWNEPSNAKLRPGEFAAFKAFVAQLAAVARELLPGAALTLGSRHLLDLAEHWSDLDVDWQQVHFYDSFVDEGLPALDYAPTCLGLAGRRLLVGELDPTGDTYSKIEKAYRAGYGGVLLWSWRADDGFTLDLEPIRRWKMQP